MKIDEPIGTLKGIGEKSEKLFEKLGVHSVRDLLLAFPRDYKQIPSCISIQDVVNQKDCAIMGRLSGVPLVKGTRNLMVTIAKVTDGTGILECVWFRMPYLKNSLKSGTTYVFFGKITRNSKFPRNTRFPRNSKFPENHHYKMEQPAIYTPEQYEQIAESYQPVYALIKGLSNNQLRKFIMQAHEAVTPDIEFLPAGILERNQLMAYHQAIGEIHFPSDLETLQKAHDRLAFNEFFMFLLQMNQLKEHTTRMANQCLITDVSLVLHIKDQLPYHLTSAQERSLNEILGDMQDVYAMQRLLQGDVGSGKTIVAFLAMVTAAANGYQAAIMAPTEVLAVQHYETFCQWCNDFDLDFPVILLTGSATAKEKREIYEQIRETDSAFIVGTHALIQEKVDYRKLGLVITDEQHRFGVRQREVFANKGQCPHILVMSATPIPRTLAIILYGDFDISVMNELPANRLPIKNCVVGEDYRKTAYSFLEKEIRSGHQVYIICPLVEESENLEAENVTDYTEHLKAALPAEIAISCLHGKMKPKEKNEIMDAYQRNEIQILISTTVIEVGVNVPNATVMMIENAERFGLAQLHQLRGRVGRGDAQSYCILVNGSDSKHAKKRLEILNQSNDGFEIARQDLNLRGPGDFFGIRQSGMLEFRVGDVFNDADILSIASEESKQLLKKDPGLNNDENLRLKNVLEEYMTNQNEKINI